MIWIIGITRGNSVLPFYTPHDGPVATSYAACAGASSGWQPVDTGPALKSMVPFYRTNHNARYWFLFFIPIHIYKSKQKINLINTLTAKTLHYSITYKFCKV